MHECMRTAHNTKVGCRNMPDVFATKDSILCAFEVKSARTSYAKITHSQIVKIKEFLDFFSFYPHCIGVLAVMVSLSRLDLPPAEWP